MKSIRNPRIIFELLITLALGISVGAMINSPIQKPKYSPEVCRAIVNDCTSESLKEFINLQTGIKAYEV